MPSTDDRSSPQGGERTTSKVTIGFDLVHAGDAEALAEHLLVELRLVAARWGVDVGSTWVVHITTLTGQDQGDDQ